MADGLLMVYTGNGPEHNPSPLGQVFRALGRGQRVCVIAFGKESKGVAHLASEESFGDLLECYRVATGQQGDSVTGEPEGEAMRQAFRLVKQMMLSGRFQMLFLDRFTDLATDDSFDAGDLIQLLLERPTNLNVLISGKSLPTSLLEAADLVTRVEEIKGE
jgi:cob(I)alamin adenosyltransferase